jgi:hypothetical protein
MAAARVSRRCRMRSLRPGRVRAPWRSRVRVPLQLQKMLSMRWRIGARCGAAAGFVLAAGPEDRGVHVADGLGERPAGVALVAGQSLSALAAGAGQQLQRDVPLVAFGGGNRDRPGCAVGREDRVQPETPEKPGMVAAVAVVRGIRQLRALDGLAASGALHRCAVNEQQIVVEPGALAGEHAHQPLERVREATAALEVAGLAWDAREQVAKVLGSDRQESAVRGNPHDRLSNAERDDLCVCDASLGVLRLLGQEIVSRHVNGSEQQVEVGVHRGPLRSTVCLSTADFDPAAQKSSISTRIAMESII